MSSLSHPATLKARHPDAPAVHGSLGVLFGVLWLLTALHLLVGLRSEVWNWSWEFIAYCAAPPLYPFVGIAVGDFGGAAFAMACLSLVVVAWWLASRRPVPSTQHHVAIAIIIAYWIFLDFALAFSA